MKKIISFITIVTFLFYLFACDTEQANSVDGTGETEATVNGGKSTTSTMIYNIKYYNTKNAKNNNVTTFKNTDNITLNNIYCDGYTFLGWYDASTGGNKIIGWGAGSKTKDITLYGHWSVNKYNIKLNTDGNINNIIQATYDAMMPNITEKPTKIGFQFAGYWTEAGGKGMQYVDKDGKGCRIWNLASDTMLYADWLENGSHFITYIGADDCENTNPTSFKETQYITLQNITKIGYTFVGLYDNESYLGSPITYWNAGEKTEDVRLYAKWTANSYNIDLLDEITYECQSVTAVYGEMLSDIIITAVPGYQFFGYYYKGSDGVETKYIDENGNGCHVWDIDHFCILYSKYLRKEHTITYVGADEENSTDNPKTYLEISNVQLYPLYRTGYIFCGWYDNESFLGASISSWEPGDKTEDLTLYAKWILRKYTVKLYYHYQWWTLDADVDPLTTIYGEMMPDLTVIPTRTGYRFGGCFIKFYVESIQDYEKIKYIDKDGKGCHIWDIDNDCGIEIEWIADTEHFITYIGAEGCDNSANPQSYNEAQSVAINNITKTGYDFGGWYDNESYEGSPVTSWGVGDNTGDVTLYAKWTVQTYTISYKDQNDNNFSGTMSGQPTTHTYNTATQLVSPTKDYYDFAGWHLQSDCSDNSISMIVAETITSDTILYAKWTLHNYTITYNNVFDGTNTNQTTFTVEDNVSLSDSARAGYTFNGWYDAAEGGNQVTGWNAESKTENVTVWARWTANIYTVEFNANGGTGSMSSQLFTYDETQNLTACGFIAPEWRKFGTWNTKADGTGLSYTDEQSISNITAENNETVQLYAQWIEKATHQIIYNNIKTAYNELNPQTFGESQNITLQDLSLVGWIFDGWFDAENEGNKVTGWNFGEKREDVTVWARWTAESVNYTVKTYFQKVDGNGYEQNLSQYPNLIEIGTTETTTNVTAEDNIIGFVLQPIEQQMIAGNGSTVVGVYYNRKTVTYTFDANGKSWNDGTTENKIIIGLYGAVVNKPEKPTKAGWICSWNSECPSVFGVSDMVFTIEWTAEWCIDDISGNFVCGDTVYNKTSMVNVLSKSTSIICDQSDGVFTSNRGSVTLSPYNIGKYEVTQELYTAVMGANPSQFTADIYPCGPSETNALLRPVGYISWFDAMVFCNKLSLLMGKKRCYKLSDGCYPDEQQKIPTVATTTWLMATCDWSASGYRMPTECEWECAARGGIYSNTKPWTYTYSGSDTMNDISWNASNSKYNNRYGSNVFRTWEVGLKQPNSLGIYDMSGNVLEMCWDYHDYYNNPPIDSSTPVTGQERSSSSSSRKARGGYYSNSVGLEVYGRLGCTANQRVEWYGIRIACNGE